VAILLGSLKQLKTKSMSINGRQKKISIFSSSYQAVGKKSFILPSSLKRSSQEEIKFTTFFSRKNLNNKNPLKVTIKCTICKLNPEFNFLKLFGEISTEHSRETNDFLTPS
jgi:hypothetical protein